MPEAPVARLPGTLPPSQASALSINQILCRPDLRNFDSGVRVVACNLAPISSAPDRAFLSVKFRGRRWRAALALCTTTVLPLQHLAGQLTPAVGRPGTRVAPSRPVRMVVVATGDAADGARMGATEAQRAALLMQRTFQIVIVDAPALVPAVDFARYAILVGGERTGECRAVQALAAAFNVVYVNAWCDDDVLRALPSTGCAVAAAASTLHVAPSQALRRAALGTLPSTEREHVLAVAWHGSLERFGAGEVNARFRQQFRRDMSERAWLGWAAVKLVTDLALQSGSPTIADALARKRAFDAHKGRALRVREGDGQLLQPLYLVQTGDSARAASRVIAEVSLPHTLSVDSVVTRRAAECVK